MVNRLARIDFRRKIVLGKVTSHVKMETSVEQIEEGALLPLDGQIPL